MRSFLYKYILIFVISEFNIENNKDSAVYTIKNDLNNTAQRDYIKNYMQTNITIWKKWTTF